jgi:predicted phage terminase large subunit-like protein
MDTDILQLAQENLDKLPPAAQQKIGQLIAEARKLKTQQNVKNDFMSFVNYVWPSFIHGKHHQIMANAFERVARGELKRLIVNMPPRHTKSEFASYLLPAWFLGQYPDKQIIQTAHTTELAVGFGRKVRNLVDSDRYRDIFPDVGLRADSKAAGRWNTNHNGVYFSIGVGGAVTGRGADLFIIDDAHSEQEATLAESNPEIYDKTYEWYTSGPRQRLQPGGAIVIVMCMTGDTDVLMANGATTQLKDIRVGDRVATFDKGRLGVSRVNNWRSSGVDSIYTVQTQSGIILRANERHPFLVLNEGVLEWTRLRTLKPGMLLVAMKGAQDQQDHKPNPDYVTHAKLETTITRKTLKHPTTQLDITGNGKVRTARVENPQNLRGYVAHAIQKNIHQQNQQQSRIEQDELNTDTGLPLKPIVRWLKSAEIGAMLVGKYLLQKIQELTGMESCVLTIATTQEKLGACSVTTVTSQWAMERQQIFSNELRRISDFTTDPIVSITYAGEEEVFDVEVDRTENFIANGIVSHNTRWSKKDLTGQILKAAAQRTDEEWEVIEFPAILPSGNPLWPQFWSIKELETLRATLPSGKWMAQYQQQPTSDAAAIIKREWWRIWEHDDPPSCEFIIQSWDTAFLKTERSDYSACTTWGVFYKEDDTGVMRANIILLDAVKKRMEFPELKQKAYEMYTDWEPDSLIVEAKASGAPLVFELRAMGIPVQEFTPSKGNDKIARLNACTDMFASGMVWAPNTHWAEELIDEVASFPSGEHDDLVDSMSQAMMRFRKGGFLRLPSDEPDEERYFKRKVAYY